MSAESSIKTFQSHKRKLELAEERKQKKRQKYIEVLISLQLCAAVFSHLHKDNTFVI